MLPWAHAGGAIRTVASGTFYFSFCGMRHWTSRGRYGHLLVSLWPVGHHGTVSNWWFRNDDCGHVAGPDGESFATPQDKVANAG